MVFDRHHLQQINSTTNSAAGSYPKGSYPNAPCSLSAPSESDEHQTWTEHVHHSRHSSMDRGRSHNLNAVSNAPSSGKQLNFVIDGQGILGSDEPNSPVHWTKKDRITSKMKVLSTTISTAIDQMTSKAYSHGVSKTVPDLSSLSQSTTTTNTLPLYGHPDHREVLRNSPRSRDRTDFIERNAINQTKRGQLTLVPTTTESRSTEFTESDLMTRQNYGDQHNKCALKKQRKESVATDSETVAMTPVVTGTGTSGIGMERSERDRGHTASSTAGHGVDGNYGNYQEDMFGGGAGYERHQTVSVATSSRTHEMSIITRGTASTMDLDEMVLPRSQQTLPFHWPFSSYPVSKRTKRGKVIETVVMTLIVIIYFLPVIAEKPRPAGAPSNYNVEYFRSAIR